MGSFKQNIYKYQQKLLVSTSIALADNPNHNINLDDMRKVIKEGNLLGNMMQVRLTLYRFMLGLTSEVENKGGETHVPYS